MAFVYNKTLNTDDGNGNANVNCRNIIQPSQLSAAVGNLARLWFLWGPSSPPEQGSITSCYFGQSAGGTSFKGDQVPVTFNGQPSFGAQANAVVASDWFVLPQLWDNSQAYTCAFHFKSGSAAHGAIAGSAGVTLFFDNGAPDNSSQNSPSGLINTGPDAFLLTSIETQFIAPVNAQIRGSQQLVGI